MDTHGLFVDIKWVSGFQMVIQVDIKWLFKWLFVDLWLSFGPFSADGHFWGNLRKLQGHLLPRVLRVPLILKYNSKWDKKNSPIPNGQINSVQFPNG